MMLLYSILLVHTLQAYTMIEVQQSLPHQAYQFALIDKQWRELMFNTARNPNVMQLCCKAGEYHMYVLCPVR